MICCLSKDISRALLEKQSNMMNSNWNSDRSCGWLNLQSHHHSTSEIYIVSYNHPVSPQISTWISAVCLECCTLWPTNLRDPRPSKPLFYSLILSSTSVDSTYNWALQVFFCPLFISLSIMSISFIQVVTTDRLSCPLSLNDSPLWLCHIFFVHSSSDGNQGCDSNFKWISGLEKSVTIS